jgi:hypothetical protein
MDKNIIQNKNVIYKHTENKGDKLFYVYTAKSWQDAIEFLHKYEVRKPLNYVVVETPEGNLGKDIISIYNELDGKTLELGYRKPLPEIKKSLTHCCRCEYFVFPMEHFNKEVFVKEVRYFLSLEDMQNNGNGFYCSKCKTVWCAICVSFCNGKVFCDICGSDMDFYQKLKKE